jgi:hypothetical protein
MGGEQGEGTSLSHNADKGHRRAHTTRHQEGGDRGRGRGAAARRGLLRG